MWRLRHASTKAQSIAKGKTSWLASAQSSNVIGKFGCRDNEHSHSVKATLKFDKAGTVDIEYPILAIGASAPGTASGGGMKMQGGGMMQMGH
jgi:hypothetical protein